MTGKEAIAFFEKAQEALGKETLRALMEADGAPEKVAAALGEKGVHATAERYLAASAALLALKAEREAKAGDRELADSELDAAAGGAFMDWRCLETFIHLLTKKKS